MTLVAIDRLRIPNDETAIPLLREDTYLVSEYASAMRLYGGWGDFPSILCDQEYLVIGGVTRVLAARVAEVAKVPCNIQAFEDAGARLLAAAADNAQHGKRWESRDVARIGILAERFGVETEALAQAMRVTTRRIERVPVVTVMRGRGKEAVEEKLYAKRAVRPRAGRLMTEREAAVMDKLGSPHAADRLLEDLIRLDELGVLPPLNAESHRIVVTAQRVMANWLERDAHLLAVA
jgi:hypothetical protein